jgi:DNA-binding transcriptional ArsR family regulator
MAFQPRTQADWDLLASSSRVAILQALEALGPSSVPALAEALGRSPEGLYHHMRLLESAGLVRVVDRERRHRRMERRFALTGSLQLACPGSQDQGLIEKGLLELAGAVTRAALRRFRAYLAGGGVLPPATQSCYSLRTESAYLDGPSRAALREHLTAIQEIFRAAQARTQSAPAAAPSDQQLIHAVWLMHPERQPAAQSNTSIPSNQAHARF